MHRTQTARTALCGVLGALGLVLLALGSVLPLATYAAPMLAAFALIPLVQDCPPRYAWLTWAATALLALMLLPDRELALTYALVLGPYPMLKKHIYYFHMKDALLADGSVVPCGMGDGSVPEILKDYGGDETGLTIEPHLKVFADLNALQGEELHHKYAYSDNRTAFRAAVDAVKSILTDAGYREGEANRWIK